MSKVRVLVGTRKGAFILASDGKREKWDVSGPHFAGWEIYHMKGSPADPNRIYASQSSGWFGQFIQRSDDGGKTWHQPGTPPGEPPAPGPPKAASNKFVYDASAETGKPLTTHQWYDGTQHPWEFKRVWHLEPSLTDPDDGLCGRRRCRAFPLDRRRRELAGTLRPARPRHRTQMAAGRGRHVPAHHHSRSRATLTASSSPSRRRALSAPTTAARPGSRSTGLLFAIHPRPDRRGRPLRSPRCHAPIAARTCSSCRSTGTSCAATTPATPGRRSAETCPPTSAS